MDFKKNNWQLSIGYFQSNSWLSRKKTNHLPISFTSNQLEIKNGICNYKLMPNKLKNIPRSLKMLQKIIQLKKLHKNLQPTMWFFMIESQIDYSQEIVDFFMRASHITFYEHKIVSHCYWQTFFKCSIHFFYLIPYKSITYWITSLHLTL